MASPEAPPARILLVDDQPTSLQALEAALSPLGQPLVRARSGQDALVKLAGLDVALIVMDLQMPGLDGLVTLSLLQQRERAASVPVILISGGADREAILKAHTLGAVAFVQKPFDAAMLRAQAGAFIGLHLRNARQRVQADVDRARERSLDQAHAAREAQAAAVSARNEFLATVSHELRTPLSAIVGWAELLRSGRVEPERMQEGIQIILHSARAQNRIVEDLLDDARIAAGKLALSPARMELVLAVHAAVDAVRLLAAEREVEIALSVPQLACELYGDAHRLTQVIWNLLSNAIKFSGRGGRVEVRLERILDTFVLQVRDQGQGIARAFLPFVFDRFRQADVGRSRHAGLGLGLAIARHIVELHAGSIEVDSDGEGRGAVFRVTLPAASAGSDLDAPELPVETDMSEKVTSLMALIRAPELLVRIDGVRAVVVDDDDSARQLLRAVLEDAGAQVTLCRTVDEALLAVQRERFDILLSDLLMPETDGFELGRRLRELGRGRGGDLPAIALSAYGGVEERDRALAAGFQTHLAKPFAAPSLVALIARLTRRV